MRPGTGGPSFQLSLGALIFPVGGSNVTVGSSKRRREIGGKMKKGGR
jgi:hypothetical protein